MLGLSRLGIGFDSLGLTQQEQQAVLDHVFNAPDATQQLVVSVKAADSAGARRGVEPTRLLQSVVATG